MYAHVLQRFLAFARPPPRLDLDHPHGLVHLRPNAARAAEVTRYAFHDRFREPHVEVAPCEFEHVHVLPREHFGAPGLYAALYFRKLFVEHVGR